MAGWKETWQGMTEPEWGGGKKVYQSPSVTRNMAAANPRGPGILKALEDFGPRGVEGINMGLDAVVPPGGPDMLQYGAKGAAPGARSWKRAADVADAALGSTVERGAIERLARSAGPTLRKYGKYAGPVGAAVGAAVTAASAMENPRKAAEDILLGLLAPGEIADGGLGGPTDSYDPDRADEFQRMMYYGRAPDAGEMGPPMAPPSNPALRSKFGLGKPGTRVRRTPMDSAMEDPTFRKVVRGTPRDATMQDPTFREAVTDPTSEVESFLDALASSESPILRRAKR